MTGDSAKTQAQGSSPFLKGNFVETFALYSGIDGHSLPCLLWTISFTKAGTSSTLVIAKSLTGGLGHHKWSNMRDKVMKEMQNVLEQGKGRGRGSCKAADWLLAGGRDVLAEGGARRR